MKISVEQLLRRWNVLAVSPVRAGVLISFLLPGMAAFGEGLSDSVLQQISALQGEKATRTPAQLKLDSQLVYAWKRAQGLPYAPGVTNLKLSVNVESDGRVQVDMDANVNASLLEAIAQAGGQVQFSSGPFKAIRALVPLSQLEALASRTDVKFIRVAVQAATHTGSVDSEGDTTHRAIEARQAFLTDGFGVNVGVLSDSVDYLAAAQATGDLPPNVTVLPGQSGIPGSGEGTAMLEIVNDLAPGAGLFYATAFNGGPAGFAQNILNLRAAGCDIIIDDVIYFNESPFQDGVVAQAVNAVTADGALFYSSAGNEGNLRHGTSGTWQGDFVDGGAAGAPVNGKNGNLHLFGTNAWNTMTVPGGGINMFWSDPLGASTNDYDLYVVDTNGTTIISASTTVQNGTQDPYEFAFATDFDQRVVVVKATGDPRFLYLENFRGQLELSTDGNIRGHNCATNAVAVAAVDIHNAYPNQFTGGPNNPVESFSSDGPRHVFFNVDGSPITPTNFLASGGYVRQKPDISAADGVSTTLPSFSGLNPFYGTSAAAPHAGAIAALIMSYNDNLSTRNVRNLMNFTALDIEAGGYDNTAGNGIAMAYEALQAAPLPAPFPRPILLTNYISGGNANGVIDFNECNTLDLVLTNIGRADATGVRATLSSSTPGVTIARPTVPYSNIPVGTAATNLISFQVSTAPDFNCGIPIRFSLVVKSDQNSLTNNFSLPTGVPGIPLRFDNNQLVPIPDVGVAYSTITLSNINFALNRLTVSLHITHTFDAQLLIQLISPDGTTNTLSANHGAFGQDYGFTCNPDFQRTTFDDSAQLPIAFATAPFVGTFLPDQPLSVFAGKAGTNVNGVWTLRVQDTLARDVGAIQCWSMFLTPTLCMDGGGECPGSDLGVGMTALPEPVIIGDNLIYSISVTNNGPSGANSVVVTHVLPPSSIFVSASPSQGGFSQSGGVLTCNLGPMKSRSRANISVVVMPTTQGLVSSSATVGSEQSDFNSANNTATVFTDVNPPTADLFVQLVGLPNPNVVGGNLTFTATVTNNGPSSASGVWLTNLLPDSVILRSATVSQGALSTSNNLVVCNFGALTNGAVATATMSVFPTAAGALVATSTAIANQFDPIVTNNVSIATITVGAAADLAVNIADSPDPVVIRSNLTYLVSVTNNGPNTATGIVLNQTLPASATIISVTSSQGNITQQGTALTVSIGTLESGASAVVTVVLSPTLNGPLTTTASVSGAQADPDQSNNTVTNATQVSPPFISIVPAGASLLTESMAPTNGAIDIGETVTVSLRLRNAGNVNNTNLIATLLPSDGITPLPPNSPQTYGVLKPSGFPVSRSFSFTANGTNGQTITAKLQLLDGSANLGTVSYDFTLPSIYTFSNTNAIAILDNKAASIYPSIISVPPITGLVGNVSVTLSNISHTFPQDIDALLVGPAGQSTMLMSGAGASPLLNADVTFDDRASLIVPDGSSQIVSGSYRSADYLPALNLPAPAPAGPYSTALSVFNTVNPLTNWSLYVDDHSTGDTGSIVGGWSLSITMITPVNQLADVGVVGITTPRPSVANGSLTYLFTVTNAGPNTASFVGFTNSLPAGVKLISATASQGTVLTNGTSVGANIGSLKAGAVATVNVVVSPSASVAGELTSVASVAATESDLNPANNTVAVVSTVSLPAADLALSQTAAPEHAVVGGILTYTLAVTNAGPGASLSTVLTNTLPPGVTFVSATSSSGSIINQGNSVICQFGDLAPNGTATASILAIPAAIGSVTNVAIVATGSKDPNSTDNTSILVTTVGPRAPQIASGGARMTAESFSPPDSTIEPGETVTIAFALTNSGSAPTTALVATLQPTGGVTSPSGPQTYGVIQNGGSALARPFTFTASGASGDVITATFTLVDGATDLGSVAFTFRLPTTSTYSTAASILIPDRGQGNPYPSTLTVKASDAGQVTRVKVTLLGLNHSFPHDISALLVSPSGGTTLLMSHTGGGHGLTNVNLTFDDSAATMLPNSGSITNGTYKPSSYEGSVSFPRPASAGPYGKELAALNGQDPNGLWALYLLDDTTGDAGNIATGWSLDITMAVTVNPVADLNLTLSSAPSTIFVGDVFTNIITITNLGPSAATAVMLTNVLPLGVNFVSCSPPGTFVGTFGGYVAVSLGNIAVGGGATVFVVGAPGVGATVINTANVASGELDLNPVNNTAQATVKVVNPIPATLDASVANGQFYLSVAAQPGLDYVILASTNLSSWLPLSTNTADSAGLIQFTEPLGPSQRYYRTARSTR